MLFKPHNASAYIQSSFLINLCYNNYMLAMTKYFEIDDCRLSYTVYGEGKEVLIFLHGNGGSGQEFSKNIRAFSHYRCITIDMREQGNSGKTDRELTYELFANDVAEFLIFQNIAQCSVIGFSDGAITALYLAKMIPQKINKMILIGCNYNIDGIKLRYKAMLQICCACFWLFRFFRPIKKYCRLYKMMLYYPQITQEELKEIHIPALVTAGQFDMVKEKHTVSLADNLCAKLQIIKRVGHFWHKKHYKVFNNMALKFLNT